MKNSKFKIAAILLTSLTLSSCYQPPFQESVKEIMQNDSIELFKYEYSENQYPVFVARFKNKPVLTITQTIPTGKSSYRQGTIMLENDSIVILKK